MRRITVFAAILFALLATLGATAATASATVSPYPIVIIDR